MSLLSIFKPGLLTSKPTTGKPKPVAPPEVKSVAGPDLAVIQSQAREIILEAKDEAIRIKDQSVKDAKTRLEEIEAQARLQTQKQQELIRQDEQLNRARIGLDEETKKAEKMRADLVSKQEDLVKKLEKIASLTTDEAREILIKEVQKKSAGQIAKTIKEAEEKAKSESDELAKEILVDAMRAGATDYVAEFTVSTVATSAFTSMPCFTSNLPRLLTQATPQPSALDFAA